MSSDNNKNNNNNIINIVIILCGIFTKEIILYYLLRDMQILEHINKNSTIKCEYH